MWQGLRRSWDDVGLGKRRLSLRRPSPDPEVWAREEEARRPIASEIARVRSGTLWTLAAIGIWLIPSSLWIMYSLTGAFFDPIDLGRFASWVRTERSTWDANVLLGLPVTVLVPGVLAILLASRASSADVEMRSARELAHLETTKLVLSWGLTLGVFLSLLAVIPEAQSADHASQLLGLAIGVACAVFRQLLHIEGTQRDLLVAMAVARREAVLEVRKSLTPQLAQQAPRTTRVLRTGPKATLTLVILGLALVGLPVAIPLSVLGALGRDHSWPQDLGVALFLGLIAASQSLFLLVALSRWRLATSRGERIGACGFALVPVSLAAMAILGAATSSTTSGPNVPSWVLVGCLLLADSIALRINSTAVASVIDYRRLSVLEGYAASQIAWLDGPSLSSASHGDARVGVD